MPEEAATGPVATFCAELRELQRSSGRSPSGLAQQLNISRGQLYAILNGEIKRPPDFSRVVEPLVRACGGDDAAIADWRRKHDVLERVHEQLRRQRRLEERRATAGSAVETIAPASPTADTAPETAAGSAPAGSAGSASASASGTAAGFDPEPPGQPEYAGRRRWKRWAALAASLAVLAAVAVVLTIHFSSSPSAPAVFCTATAPGADGDLLSVPRNREADGKHSPDWWENNGKVRDLSFDLHSFSATVNGGTPNIYDLLIVHSCNPVVAGKRYRLSFTASAQQTGGSTEAQKSKPVRITVRVQDLRKENGYLASLDEEDVDLPPTPKPFSFDFTGAVTQPASEVLFEVGAHPEPFKIKVTGINLVLLG